MAIKKKKKKGSAGNQYYVVLRQMPANATLFGMSGDYGLVIDPMKIALMTGHRADQLKRLYGLEKRTVKATSECRCGCRFQSEPDRNAHIQRRHLARGPKIVDFQDLPEEQKYAILHGTGGRGSGGEGQATRKDGEQYLTTPLDFNTPDPEDRQMGVEDRKMLEEIDWTQTQASNA